MADGSQAAGLLSGDRRVISFCYGEESQIAPMLDRAMALIDDAGASQFDLLGFSIGGWFAQCLAARDPERVRKLVLAHSFTLEAGAAWRFGLASYLWPVIPAALRRSGILKRARMALAPLRIRDPAQFDLVLRQLAEALDSPPTHARLLAQQQATRDSLLRMGGCIAPQPVLIVESDNDRLVGASARRRLRRKYPDARCVVIAGAGHASALSAPVELVAAIEGFLAD